MNVKKENPAAYLILPGVILITLFVYLPVLKNHLVADSWVFVIKKGFVETLSYFFQSIIPPEWNAQWLRPLPMLTFWVDNKIWPGTEWGPHLTNLLFHILNVFLIMKVVNFSRVYSSSLQKKIKYGLPEFVSGIIFGLHPLCVGATGWVGARFDVMGTTLGLLSMLLWLIWDFTGKKTSSLLIFLTVITLSLLCKEQSIVFFVSAFLSALIMTFINKKKIREYIPLMIALVAIPIVYAIYRFSIFHGTGGYLESGGEFNLNAPFAYFAAIIFPWLNVFDNWSFGILFWVSSLFVSLMTVVLWNSFRRAVSDIKMIFIIMPFLNFIIGLATTVPHAGIGFKEILGHAESRFSMIAIAGISILAGVITAGYIKSAKIHKIVTLIIFVIGVGFSWRTGVQIQAWHDAGNTAHQIISSVLTEAPNPPKNCKMYFFDIPRGNNQYAYIFGIGLKEAILRNYPERDDIVIIPRASGKDLRKVDTARDFVFGFNKSRWLLERLYAQNK